MSFHEIINGILLVPFFSNLLPGLASIVYPIIGYLVVLAILFVISKLNKMPLIGVFASFVGDILIKVWLSVGIILLIISIFFTL